MKKLKHLIINYLTRNLLKAMTVEDVLQISGREWLIGARKLTKEDCMALKDEALSFHRSFLYALMIRELKYGATLQRYDKAQTADDMVFGKAMLYCISQIELFIKNIKTL